MFFINKKTQFPFLLVLKAKNDDSLFLVNHSSDVDNVCWTIFETHYEYGYYQDSERDRALSRLYYESVKALSNQTYSYLFDHYIEIHPEEAEVARTLEFWQKKIVAFIQERSSYEYENVEMVGLSNYAGPI